MPSCLVRLIDRMTAREDTVSSKDSISWHAYRDAEALEDPSVIGELDACLAQKRTRDQRSAAYFIIGKVGEDCQDPICAARLIAFASKEKDKHALSHLLDGFAELSIPDDIDLNPIYALLGDKRWLVRHAAIRSLSGSHAPKSKGKVLKLLAAASDPNDMVNCHATLNRIGTQRALAPLAASPKSRKRDVKLSAEAAIEAIEACLAAQWPVGAGSL